MEAIIEGVDEFLLGGKESEALRTGKPVLATVHDGWGWRIRTSAA